jgi:hypothetical protein
MTRPQAKLEVFFGRHGGAWRVYVNGWAAPYVRSKLDQHGEAWPVAAPDLADLRQYMWKLDAPYAEAPTVLGGVALEAQGRSAVALWEWLDGYLTPAPLER